MSRALLVLAATLVLVAAAGCSSDEGGDASGTGDATVAATTAATTEPAPATTEAETRPEPPGDQSRWARQVDAACRPWQEQIDAVLPPTTGADLERWLGETLPLVRKQVAAVDAVRLPAAKGDAATASSFVEALRRTERALTRYRAALREVDAEAAQKALADAGAAGAAARTAALDLDVTACGGYSTG